MFLNVLLLYLYLKITYLSNIDISQPLNDFSLSNYCVKLIFSIFKLDIKYQTKLLLCLKLI